MMPVFCMKLVHGPTWPLRGETMERRYSAVSAVNSTDCELNASGRLTPRSVATRVTSFAYMYSAAVAQTSQTVIIKIAFGEGTHKTHGPGVWPLRGSRTAPGPQAFAPTGPVWLMRGPRPAGLVPAASCARPQCPQGLWPAVFPCSYHLRMCIWTFLAV
jgi:hypothetical protein